VSGSSAPSIVPVRRYQVVTDSGPAPWVRRPNERQVALSDCSGTRQRVMTEFGSFMDNGNYP
jgi:hypothetical protein